MRAPYYPWALRHLLTGCPSVGCLMDLCDENYRHLLRLAPGLRTLRGRLQSRVSGGMDLHLEILEQTPYTTCIHLTYYFEHQDQAHPDPDATLRVYHDSRQVEVLGLLQRVLPPCSDGDREMLLQKWRVNLFLSKWLAYCVHQGHRFAPAELPDASCREPVTVC